ncbi:MAG: hypothetical protein NDJ89_08755 [Oligoflexia bacterium]|nr:hypothetical protein [Oligoflexia bacterium]
MISSRLVIVACILASCLDRPSAQAIEPARLAGQIVVQPFHIAEIVYHWSLSTQVTPTTPSIPLGSIGSAELKIDVKRTQSLAAYHRRPYGGTVELCLTNEGGMATSGLKVRTVVQSWMALRKGGIWKDLPPTESRQEIQDIGPGLRACARFAFELPSSGGIPKRFFRVLAIAQFDDGRVLAPATYQVASPFFKIPSIPTLVVETDENTELGIEVSLPEGFLGGGKTSLGMMSGTTTITHVLQLENTNRCGELLPWYLETGLLLKDTGTPIGEQQMRLLDPGPCLQGPATH